MPQGKQIQPCTDANLTLEELLEDFLDEKRANGLSDATLFDYRKSAEKFMCFLANPTAVDSVNQKVVLAFIRGLQDTGMKHTSINHYVRDLRAFFYWCMVNHYIQSFKIKEVKGQEEPPQVYDIEEIGKLLKKPERKARPSFTEWRAWAVVNYIYATGNRAQTVCNIQMQDVRFTSMEIHLRHTKNKRAQILPMSKALCAVLKEYIRMWRRNARPEDYLFCSVTAGKLTPNALAHSITKYNRARGVERTGIHKFRHSFSKEYILNTGNVFKLQKILGHTSLEMTRRYVNLFSDDLRADFEENNPLDTYLKENDRHWRI